MFVLKDVTVKGGSQTNVHRVGPFTGFNTAMFWGAIVAAVATTVAMATPKWVTYGGAHAGLWRACSGSYCVNVISGLPGWFKFVQALVCLALIASLVTLALAIVYTFLHSVNKNVVITVFIVASWLSALFMIVGFSIYGGKMEKQFGFSFYFAIAAAIFHIVIGFAGGMQKKKSG